MTLHSELTDAAEATALVVDRVTPTELTGTTPCDEWDVQALLNHVILWSSHSLERRAQGESVAPELMERDFAAAPDFADAYRAQLDRALAAWADPAVWDRELDVMGSKTPAADVGALMIAELVLHGWDLAAATGQDYVVSDRAAEGRAERGRGQRRALPPVQGVRRPGADGGRRADPRPRARAVRTRPGLDARRALNAGRGGVWRFGRQDDPSGRPERHTPSAWTGFRVRAGSGRGARSRPGGRRCAGRSAGRPRWLAPSAWSGSGDAGRRTRRSPAGRPA